MQNNYLTEKETNYLKNKINKVIDQIVLDCKINGMENKTKNYLKNMFNFCLKPYPIDDELDEFNIPLIVQGNISYLNLLVNCDYGFYKNYKIKINIDSLGKKEEIKEKSKEILIEILNAKYNLNLSNTESNHKTRTTKETDSSNSKVDSSQSSSSPLQLSSSMDQAYNNFSNQTGVKVAGE